MWVGVGFWDVMFVGGCGVGVWCWGIVFVGGFDVWVKFVVVVEGFGVGDEVDWWCVEVGFLVCFCILYFIGVLVVGIW